MYKMMISLLLLIQLSACSQLPNPIMELRKEDIAKYGVSYEVDKLFKLGIEGISYDEDGHVIFYVQRNTPETRARIEKGLIKIFGQSIDFELQEIDEIFTNGLNH
ncbi:hypothetical protein ACFYKX_04830 [Cytobacillus sp. FJAT-54145]|uniref:Uncharacterized protein n=1 Tax=Cytobacillus spartinae TaxID=3299023 RepID=A0ABW6KAI6_9BACI